MAESHLNTKEIALDLRQTAARPILAKFPNINRTINPKLYSQSHDYLYLLLSRYFIILGVKYSDEHELYGATRSLYPLRAS